MVYIDAHFRRRGIASMLYYRFEAWAVECGIAFGPADKLMDDDFAFWKARQSLHPRVVADARNYMDRLLEYGRKRNGEAVQIDVELDGRTVEFGLPRTDYLKPRKCWNMRRSKTSLKKASSQTSPGAKNEAGFVPFAAIRTDAAGIVTAPKILAGLPLNQVMSDGKRAKWVELRSLDLVPSED